MKDFNVDDVILEETFFFAPPPRFLWNELCNILDGKFIPEEEEIIYRKVVNK